MLQFMERYRKLPGPNWNAFSGTKAPPIVVHCSAGVGRTGTLIGIYNIIESIKYTLVNYQSIKESQQKNKYLEQVYPEIVPYPLRVSLFGTVRKLREQRIHMVKMECQYKFIYVYMQRWATQFLGQLLSDFLKQQ